MASIWCAKLLHQTTRWCVVVVSNITLTNEEGEHMNISWQWNTKTNETTPLSLTAELDLHGYKKEITLLVDVIKLSDSSLVVNSTKPVFIKANDFSLVKGIEKLRSLAGLPSISTTVPVSFSLRLNKDK